MPPIPSRPHPSDKKPAAVKIQVGAGAISCSWTTKKLAITLREEGTNKPKEVYVDAQVSGDLAIHKQACIGACNWGGWAVTAINDGGRLIVVMLEEEDARRVVSYLNRICPAAFKEKDRDSMAEMVPDWVKNWIRGCREKRIYVDPAPFKLKVKT